MSSHPYIPDAPQVGTGSTADESASPGNDQVEASGAGIQFGPSRKQNVACDSCRARKVKCNRAPGADKCIHCSQKDVPCTSHYIEQLSSARKQKQAQRETAVEVGITANAGSSPPAVPRSDGSRYAWPSTGSEHVGPVLRPSDIETYHAPLPFPHTIGSNGGIETRPLKRVKPNPSSVAPLESLAPLPPTKGPPRPLATLDHLLEYLLSPNLARSVPLGYIDRREYLPLQPTNVAYNAVLQQAPTSSHLRLMRESDRRDLANDLIETYFQIVQIRMPFVRAHLFKRRYDNPGGPEGPNSNLSIAMVLAWGARFSEHPIIVQDRIESSAGLPNGRKRSRLVLLLTMRYQWIMDHEGADKVVSLDNMIAQCSMGALRGADPQINVIAYRTAASCALALRYNTQEGIESIPDSKARSFAVYAFWLLTESATSATMYRRARPALFDGDWDFDLQQFDTSNNWGTDVQLWGRTSVMDWLVYQEAFDDLFRNFRQIQSQWWRPRCLKEGLPVSDIKIFTDELTSWKERYLAQAGVPAIWPPTWDFAAAVAACTVDIVFHSTWPVIAEAVSDYGIREIKMMDRGDPLSLGKDPMETRIECSRARDRVEQEALHASLRIAALAAVLAVNNYLRLDPFILAHAITAAGRFLAKHGRHEVSSIISGLRDIGVVFYECYDLADEIEALATAQTRSRPPATPSLAQSRVQHLSRESQSASESPPLSAASLPNDFRRFSSGDQIQQLSSYSGSSPATAATTSINLPNPGGQDVAGHSCNSHSNGWDTRAFNGHATEISIPQDFWPTPQPSQHESVSSPYPPVVQNLGTAMSTVPMFGQSYTGQSEDQ